MLSQQQKRCFHNVLLEADCKGMTGVKEYPSFPLTVLGFGFREAKRILKCDGRFLGYLAYAEAVRHQADLAAAAARNLPDVPLTNIVACLDMSAFQYKVMALDDLTLEHFVHNTEGTTGDGMPYTQAILDSVKARRENFTLVKMTLAARGSALVVIAVGNSIWT